MSTLAQWLTFLQQPFGLDGATRIAVGAAVAGIGLAGIVALVMWRSLRRAARRRHGGQGAMDPTLARPSASVPATTTEPVAPLATLQPVVISRPLPDVMTEVAARPVRISGPTQPLKLNRGEVFGAPPAAPGSVAVAERSAPELAEMAGLVPVDRIPAEMAMEGLDLLVPQMPEAPAAERAGLAETAHATAQAQYERGLALLAGATGEPVEGPRQAIACFRRAQQIWTREAAPERWAAVENDIGRAYQEILDEHRAANLRTAIEHHLAALEIFDPVRHAMSWAWTQAALGAAYQNLPVGSALANARAAVAYHQRALDVFTQENAPLAWAWNQNNLCAAFELMRGGAEGEWVARLRDAAACYEAALEVYTREANPVQHQIVARNLTRVCAELRVLE